MTTESIVGIQTRAMTEAQCIEDGEQTNNPEQTQGTDLITATGQDTQGPPRNPTVDLHKTDDEVIKEFVRRQGTIALDWYVPDFCNT